MMIEVLKSKIHGATITQTEIDYDGSITIDTDLMEKANILVNEKVTVANFSNGSRFETYVIEGKAGSGIIGINGPAALLAEVGQRIVILSYASMTPEESKKFKPAIIKPDKENKVQ